MLEIKELFSALKLAPYVFFGIALATGVAIFAPLHVQQALGIESLLVSYRLWVGATFLVSASIFTSSLGAKLVRVIQPLALERWNNRQRKKELLVLSPPEIEILAEYISENTTTMSHAISNGVVAGLVAKRILYCASNLGHPGSISFDYNLQPWAWWELRKHPEYVGLPPKR